MYLQMDPPPAPPRPKSMEELYATGAYKNKSLTDYMTDCFRDIRHHFISHSESLPLLQKCSQQIQDLVREAESGKSSAADRFTLTSLMGSIAFEILTESSNLKLDSIKTTVNQLEFFFQKYVNECAAKKPIAAKDNFALSSVDKEQLEEDSKKHLLALFEETLQKMKNIFEQCAGRTEVEVDLGVAMLHQLERLEMTCRSVEARKHTDDEIQKYIDRKNSIVKTMQMAFLDPYVLPSHYFDEWKQHTSRFSLGFDTYMLNLNKRLQAQTELMPVLEIPKYVREQLRTLTEVVGAKLSINPDLLEQIKFFQSVYPQAVCLRSARKLTTELSALVKTNVEKLNTILNDKSRNFPNDKFLLTLAQDIGFELERFMEHVDTL